MDFRLLGPFQVEHDGEPVVLGPRRRERCLLGLLLLEQGKVLQADRLLDLLWDGEPPGGGRAVLRSHISHLRARLKVYEHDQDAVGIRTHGSGYSIDVAPDRVDAYRFQQLFARADRLVDPAARAELLRTALGLWRGPVLADVMSTQLRGRVAGELEERRLIAVERLAELDLQTGRAREVVAELAGRVAERPLRERLTELLMVAHVQSGSPAEASWVYHRFRERLADQMGLDPSAELRRLHERVLRQDTTVMVASAAWRRFAGLPRDISDFTGREELVARLLAAVPQSPILTLDGMPGVGKTALAVHLAHRLASGYPDGQLHVDLRGFSAERPVAPLEALARFLRALGVPAARVPVDVDEAAATYRNLLAGRRVLVVLDNAHSAGQVRPLLPGGPTCQVLVTSRDRLDGLVVRDGARRFALDVLSPEESIVLLSAILGRLRVSAEFEAAGELARLCAHLPLALRICAALLAARPGRRIAEFVADIQGAQRLEHLSVVGDLDGSVRAAFDLSYRSLRPEARQLFRRLGLVPGADFTPETVAALVETDAGPTARLLEDLATSHLVSEHLNGRYRFHDLTHCYAVERAGADETPPDRSATVARLLDFYLRRATAAACLAHPEKLRWTGPSPGGTDRSFGTREEAMRWLNAERANLVAAVRHAADHGPRPAAHRLAHVFGGYLVMGRYNVEALAVAEAGVAAADHDNDAQARAGALLDLAAARFFAEQYDPAFEDYTTALAASRQLDWREGQADALNALALLHWESDQLDVAADLHQQAIELNRAANRPAGEARSLVNLGSVHLHLGRYESAARHFSRAADLFRKAGALWGEGMALNGLGQLHHEQGRHEQASEHFTAALDIHRRTGDRHTEAEVLAGLAATQLRLGRYAEALTFARAAVDLATSTDTHRIQADARNTLGEILAVHGDHAAAAEHEHALRIATGVGYRRAKAQAHLGLAAIARAEDRYDHALHHAITALAIAREAGYQPLEVQATTVLSDVQRNPAGTIN
jgi:DNA-binding SARP family transcriptional activator/tetratricopeptide (TPR) repeat protein